jgi:hypothetical protein
MHHYTTSKRLLIVGLTMAISSSVNGQQVFPTFADQPQWNVYGGYNSFETTFYHTTAWYYDLDTTFCGWNYSKVDSEALPLTTPAYVRVEGEQVYLRRSFICDDPEVLMYDFGLSVGDTVVCAFLNWEGTVTAPCWVVMIDTIVNMGNERQRLTVQSAGFSYTHEWIRGLGSLIHPFHPIAFEEINGHGWSTLLCYWEQDEQLYQNPWFDTCDTSYTFGQSIADQGMILASLGPNPFSESFIVTIETNDPYSAELYSADGRLLLRKDDLEGTATLGHELSPGTYLLRITQGAHIQWAKVVKAQGP